MPEAVVAEVRPMPASAVVMLALAWASIPLALAGPAGVVAGLGALWARRRFLALEAEAPGHRGGRAASWVPRVARVGVWLGVGATVLLVGVSFVVDAT